VAQEIGGRFVHADVSSEAELIAATEAAVSLVPHLSPNRNAITNITV
jgi:hypothetical protein